MLKASPPTPEEMAFCAEVNRRLAAGKVSAYSMMDAESQARTYGLVFSLGSKRKTLQSDQPFHYDPPDDVIKRVREWTASVMQANRWAPATAEEES